MPRWASDLSKCQGSFLLHDSWAWRNHKYNTLSDCFVSVCFVCLAHETRWDGGSECIKTFWYSFLRKRQEIRVYLFFNSRSWLRIRLERLQQFHDSCSWANVREINVPYYLPKATQLILKELIYSISFLPQLFTSEDHRRKVNRSVTTSKTDKVKTERCLWFYNTILLMIERERMNVDISYKPGCHAVTRRLAFWCIPRDLLQTVPRIVTRSVIYILHIFISPLMRDEITDLRR